MNHPLPNPKQTRLFSPYESELAHIRELREVIAAARQRAGHPMTAREREVESMAIYIDMNYDVWDAWVDWSDDRSTFDLIVILVGGHPLHFDDDHTALHVVHASVGHDTIPCYCDACNPKF